MKSHITNTRQSIRQDDAGQSQDIIESFLLYIRNTIRYVDYSCFTGGATNEGRFALVVQDTRLACKIRVGSRDIDRRHRIARLKRLVTDKGYFTRNGYALHAFTPMERIA
ncbi:MAG: hypothetical protein PHP22_06075, partial [Oscillospiraceae bacterium]|nr:hypothetical protein [Oscillospiraceae bacterium]